jgi:Ser/Thr protein kinase RdoA (MazF antagonist)
MDHLIALYEQRLGLQGAALSLIDHEDATVATVYKVTPLTGCELVLKICSRPSDYLHEVYFLKRFAGSLPIPRVVQIVPPEAQIDGAILMECFRGALLKITDYSDTLAFEMGMLLARIHQNRVAGYGDLVQPDELSPDPRLHFTAKFEEGFEECKNHLPKALLEQCQRYYGAHINLLASVDGPCIVHRDFRPGNVMVYEGKIEGIIDWSSGRASFAEEDFCSMEHRDWAVDSTTKKSFLAGYATIRPVPDYSAVMPLLRLSKAIATIGFTVKRRTWDGSQARLYQFNRHFLDLLFKD